MFGRSTLFLKESRIHFLKLDVKGAEYDVLCGALDALRSSVLAVRAEVVFTAVYKDAAAFGDVHKLLIENGCGAGNKGGRFSLLGRYGKLISTDAVWTVNNERLFSASGNTLRDDIVRMACFLLNNGATDLAVEILQHAVSEKNISFDDLHKDPLFTTCAVRSYCCSVFVGPPGVVRERRLFSVPTNFQLIISNT